ncbi:gephyrin-like molybdotransferase Glp [Lentibacillus salicampi]|uniref:Molybdopterin molybdenumtransferase n=1 Tax=Lentibacillus salicampi TaxID=175306 RepID=A0A4Y9AHB2_9BACI|nr:gephyrin-like molybdotransferase Glp [Lentibacillus salicampi]TFJ94477.1 molybdopterin molybdotransferase MoeA [Lentibacillus salicampi]
MVEMRKPIPVEEAIHRVWEHRFTGEKECVSIHDCDNRRLSETIIAKHPVPPFPKSPYDGFALRSEDTLEANRNNPVPFKVVEHIGAGQVPEKSLHKGEATRIMTGAKIPDGADCIAMFEVCQTYEQDDHSYMSIKRTMESGQNIIGKGSEVAEGEKLIAQGTMINPGVKAVLATFGYSQVNVAKKPVIGVIATGTELLDVDEELQPGKIRNSNAHMIVSQIIRAGADYRYFGKLADEFDESYETITQALELVDVLITTGGVSVGDFDLMPAIYEKLGADVLFNKVAMRPGSVTTVAANGEKILYGLSGNPSACYVGFELFVRPLVQHGLSNPNAFPKRIKATLADDFPKPNPFKRFVRIYLTFEYGKAYANLAGMDKSNVVTSLAHTTGLMVLPGGSRGFQAGDEAEVLLLDGEQGQREFQLI